MDDDGRVIGHDDDDRLVWYFGRDFQNYLNLASGRPMAPTGQLVNDVATALRQDIINLDGLLMKGAMPLPWACSMMAEGNPLISDFRLDICRAVALLQALSKGGRHLVVVDEPSLGTTLAEICRRAGYASVATRLGSRQRLWLLRVIKAQMGALLTLGKLWAGRLLLLKAVLAPVFTDIAIISWATPGTLKQGRERDDYFGALPRWLAKRGIGVTLMFNPMLWMAPVGAFGPAAKEAILLTDFLGFGAILKAMLAVAAFPRSVGAHLILQGFDLSPLVHRAVRQELLSPCLALAHAYSSFAKSMKDKGHAPKVVFYPFENQPWERSLIWGFRQYLPQTRLIGVQHAPFARNYFSVYPSLQQGKSRLVPDIIVTTGEHFKADLIDCGLEPDRVVIGGTLRFPHMTETPPVNLRKGTGQVILISCAIDFGQSHELCHQVIAAVEGMDGVELLVNFHPTMNDDFRAALKVRLGALASTVAVRYSDERAQDLLSSVDLLMYAQTGVAFEAAVHGVPMIFVGSLTGLDLDKFDSDVNNTYRDSASLRTAIVEKLGRPRDKEAATEKVTSNFMYADEGFWLNLVRQTSGHTSGES